MTVRGEADRAVLVAADRWFDYGWAASPELVAAVKARRKVYSRYAEPVTSPRNTQKQGERDADS